MKLYTIRDRLLDYFGQPFVAPGDKDVMAALAQQINDTENTNAIAQKPEHFELHCIAQIHENHQVEPEARFVCDCASLIRGGVRDRTKPYREPTT